MLFVSTCPVPVRPLPATGFYFSSPDTSGSAGSLGACLTLVGCAESPVWELTESLAGIVLGDSPKNSGACKAKPTDSTGNTSDTENLAAPNALMTVRATQRRLGELAQMDDSLKERGAAGDGLLQGGDAVNTLAGSGGLPQGNDAGSVLAAAGRAWEQLVAQAQVDDPLQRRGTGLVAFASFGFDAATPPVFAVPRWVFGVDAAGAWLTVAYVADAPRPDLVDFMRREAEAWRVNSDMPLMNPTHPSNATPCARIPMGMPENPGRQRFEDNVRTAVAAIRAGAARKIVLARRVDFPLVKPTPVAQTCARLVAALSAKYRDCWIFSVGGLTGATPEMLLEADGIRSEAGLFQAAGEGEMAVESRGCHVQRGRRQFTGGCAYQAVGSLGSAAQEREAGEGGLVAHARVLAGTARPDEGVNLMESAKNRREHDLAVASVVEPLRALLSRRRAPEAPVSNAIPEIPGTKELSSNPEVAPHEPEVETHGPYLLELPNLAHLATDVTAPIPPGRTAFDLLGAIHPTAAVAGMPREVALDFIRAHEPNRGRYAGPVGWVDARGAGQFALALRCAQVSERTMSAQVGAGIMADSDPQAEFLETEAKLAPIRDCLDFGAGS